MDTGDAERVGFGCPLLELSGAANIYMGSSATVAASALTGIITAPRTVATSGGTR